MSDDARLVGAVVLLSLVPVETGGMYVVRSAVRQQLSRIHERFTRADPAHAGVLLLLALACQPYVDVVGSAHPWAFLMA